MDTNKVSNLFSNYIIVITFEVNNITIPFLLVTPPGASTKYKWKVSALKRTSS